MDKKKASKGWTEERRRKQAEHCRRNKPWKNATGPKTATGKTRSSMNAYKHGNRVTLRKYQKLIFHHHTKCLEAIMAFDKIEMMKINEKQSLIMSRSKIAQNEVKELRSINYSVIPTDLRSKSKICSPLKNRTTPLALLRLGMTKRGATSVGKFTGKAKELKSPCPLSISVASV